MICPECNTELQQYNVKKFKTSIEHGRRWCPSCMLTWASEEVIVGNSITIKRDPIASARNRQRCKEGITNRGPRFITNRHTDPPAVVRYKEAMSKVRGVRYK